MPYTEASQDRALLLSELRDDTQVDAAALRRVRERVSVTLTHVHLAAIGRTDSSEVRPHVRRRRAAWTGLAAALMVGTALGAGGHAVVSSYWLPQRPLAAQPVQRPKAKAGALAAPGKPLQSREPLQPPQPAATLATLPTSNPRPAPRAAQPQSAEPGLAVELAQLEQARRSLREGNAQAALALLDQNRELHPLSLLAQERDALIVKSLVAAGRYAEARAAGESFLARYPNSLLQGAVQSSLATIP